MEKLITILEDFQRNKISIEQYFQLTEGYSCEEITMALDILNKNGGKNL